MIEIEQPLRLSALKPSTHTFFAETLEEFAGADKVIYTADQPDIIELPVYGRGDAFKLYKDAVLTRLKHGFAPLLVAMSSETTRPADAPGLDYVASTYAPTSERHLRYNWVLNRMYGRALLEPDGADARELSAERAKTKTKFCNYVFSNDFMPSTQARRDFCLFLNEYKRVDCAGRSLNNTDALRKLDEGEFNSGRAFNARWHRPKLRFLSDYKFTIAFENEYADGWLTEKPLMPLAVGSVPIYWGDPRVGEFINPRSFINADDYDSYDALIERIKLVDNDPDLYEEYRNAPPILPSSRFYEMRREAPPFLERVAADALRRRAAGSPDGFMRWRRHREVGKLLYANRALIYANRQRYRHFTRAATALLTRAVKRRVRRALPPFRKTSYNKTHDNA